MFNPLQQVYIDSLQKQLNDNKLIIPHDIPSSLEKDSWWTDEWNRMHIISVRLRNDFFADYCEEVLNKAKEHYYKTGSTIMSDARYDSFEENLKLLRPDSKVLQQVGYK